MKQSEKSPKEKHKSTMHHEYARECSSLLSLMEECMPGSPQKSLLWLTFQIFFQQSLKKSPKSAKKKKLKTFGCYRACFNYWKSWFSRLDVWLLQILSEICPPLSQKLDKSGCHFMIPLHYPTPILLFQCVKPNNRRRLLDFRWVHMFSALLFPSLATFSQYFVGK